MKVFESQLRRLHENYDRLANGHNVMDLDFVVYTSDVLPGRLDAGLAYGIYVIAQDYGRPNWLLVYMHTGNLEIDEDSEEVRDGVLCIHVSVLAELQHALGHDLVWKSIPPFSMRVLFEEADNSGEYGELVDLLKAAGADAIQRPMYFDAEIQSQGVSTFRAPFVIETTELWGTPLWRWSDRNLGDNLSQAAGDRIPALDQPVSRGVPGAEAESFQNLVLRVLRAE